MIHEPRLTVVLTVGTQRERATNALQSILAQNIVDQLEILVIDLAPSHAPSLSGRDHPNVQVVRMPTNTTYGEARTEGVRLAHAPVVAFIEEHSIALPSWAEAHAQTHEGPWAIVSGGIYNANLGLGLSNIFFILDYTWLLPPLERVDGSKSGIPYNTSFKHEVLLAYEDNLEEWLFAEPVFYHKLYEDGHRMLIEPQARIAHLNNVSFGTISNYFLWNRALGYLSAKLLGWTIWQRAKYVLLTPIFPWSRLFRQMVYLIRRRRKYLGTFLLYAPLVIVAHWLAVLGRTAGLLFGPGNSIVRMSRFEVNGSRGPIMKTLKSYGE